jgi:outer membrane biosynthesis protein TonB
VLLIVGAGCSREPPGDAAGPASSATAVAWLRDAGATPPPMSDGGLAVPEEASAAALDELLAAAAVERAAPTSPDGGTRIGTPTNVRPDDAGAAPPPASPPRAEVAIGAPTSEPLLASPAIEREARAQLYWPLVQRCRDADGRILPPDAVTLTFTVDAEGYIQPSSIVASAADARHDRAAQCMIRELGAASFRMPPSGRGLATRITATVPSID